MNTIERTVDIYVKLCDRNALCELREHRQRLVSGLDHNPHTVTGRMAREVRAEVAVINAGLAKLPD
ncbi:hypothetical protein [Bradyrhizobium sp. JR3.5]